MENTVTLPLLMTQQELCEYVGKSEAWVERSRWDGSGPPYVKVGRLVRYKAEDVLTWLETGRRTSTSDPGPHPIKRKAG